MPRARKGTIVADVLKKRVRNTVPGLIQVPGSAPESPSLKSDDQLMRAGLVEFGFTIVRIEARICCDVVCCCGDMDGVVDVDIFLIFVVVYCGVFLLSCLLHHLLVVNTVISQRMFSVLVLSLSFAKTLIFGIVSLIQLGILPTLCSRQ
jgi:hypothetical protein